MTEQNKSILKLKSNISWKRVEPQDVDEMFKAFQKEDEILQNQEIKEFNVPFKELYDYGAIFKIFKNDKEVGFISTFIERRCASRNCGYFDLIYVKKEFRNQGIGTQIIRNLPKMFEEAYNVKLDMMFCACETSYKNVMKFFEKLCFKPTSIEGYFDFREKK